MLSKEWLSWLRLNMERGCDLNELREILMRNRFSEQDIEAAIAGRNSKVDKKKPEPGKELYVQLANLPLLSQDSELNIFQLVSEQLQLCVIEDFLSPEECAKVISLMSKQLRPSEVSTGDRAYRTSQTSDLAQLSDPFVEILDRKISSALGINLTYSEGIQAQRYEVGQEFKAHTDYFQPGTSEYERFAGDFGQRTWTFMIYLNEVEEGGGTHFFAINKTFTPRSGMALIWNNLYPDGTPNPDTLHAGLPVEKGSKLIITKWFRDRGQGQPFEIAKNGVANPKKK